MTIDIEKLDAFDLSNLIRTKEISPVELVEQFLKNIKEKEAQLGAWVTILEDSAIKKAHEVERKITNNQNIGPIEGVPFSVKDTFFTKGIPTKGGSKILESFIPDYNAQTLSLLINNGGILLGKNTTAEFAISNYTETRNPWNTSHSPGGSSSGSAAAVAASMSPAALGTQTAGSLNRPASYCGLVALKTTQGRISKRGVIPTSWSLDDVGVMTKTVRDQALMLNILSGYDSQDYNSLKSSEIDKNILRFDDLKDVIVGIPNEYFFDDIHENIDKEIKDVSTKFEEFGATLKEIDLPTNFNVAQDAHYIIFNSEASTYHFDNLQTKGDLYSEYVRDLLTKGLMIPQSAYIKAFRIRDAFIKNMLKVMDKIDILLVPSTPDLPPKGFNTGDPRFNAPFTMCGFPALTIPTGKSANNLPIGMQLVGKPFSDEKLLGIAHLYEEIREESNSIFSSLETL